MNIAISLSVVVLLTVQIAAVRVSQTGRKESIDPRVRIADGLKLPTEYDVSDMASTRPAANFDFIAWGSEFEARTFEQPVDHLNAYHQQAQHMNSSFTTFKQRYWINFKAWKGAAARAPIFIIISPYGGFSSYAYGTVGQLARDMGAMVVQIEGRFSPDSLPYGKSSGYNKRPNRMGLMSGENGMRDYIMLISHLRDTYDPEWVCPTATFGTSLAGMYAAWLRFKFPHVVDMSFASGSPMTGYPGTSDPLAFARTITDAWRDSTGDERCVDLIRDSFKALENTTCTGALWTRVYNEATYWAYPPRGRTSLLCQNGLTMKGLGSSPLEVAIALCGSDCAANCPAEVPEPSMWDYFSCTQVVNPIGSNGVSDFFPNDPWTTERRAANCMAQWGIEPQDEGDYHADLFGWHRLSQLADNAKRMIFSYGTYDAWTGFALATKDISPELPVFLIKGGCHGSDLIGNTVGDTEDMLAARAKGKAILERWVKEVQQRPSL